MESVGRARGEREIFIRLSSQTGTLGQSPEFGVSRRGSQVPRVGIKQSGMQAKSDAALLGGIESQRTQEPGKKRRPEQRKTSLVQSQQWCRGETVS